MKNTRYKGMLVDQLKALPTYKTGRTYSYAFDAYEAAERLLNRLLPATKYKETRARYKIETVVYIAL